MKKSKNNHSDKILDDLRIAIENDEFDKTERLPSENELAKRYKVSRFFVRKAFTELENQGVIANQPGVGRFICENAATRIERVALITSEIVQYSERDDEMLLPVHSVGWQKGALKACENRDIVPLYINRKCDNIDDYHFLIDQALRSDIDAIIAKFDMESETAAVVLKRFRDTQLPFLLFTDVREEKDVNFIDGNHYEAGQLQTNHLIENGHENIAFCTTGHNRTFCYYRFRGYVDTLKRNGLPIDRNLIVEAEMREANERFDRDWTEAGYRAGLKLLELDRDDITAIISVNDEFSDGIIQALAENGKHVPGDYSIVSFDANPRCKHLNLTTGFFPTLENVVENIDRFFDNIINKRNEVVQTFVSPILVKGKSVKHIKQGE